MLLDMHTHSTASDGQYTPCQLVNMAAEKKLELFSLTDHDSVSGIREARERAAELGIAFLSGIELSTEWGEEIHILGYGIDENDSVLQEVCKGLRMERESRGLRICAFLEGKGIAISLDEVKEIAGDGAIGRPHFALAMVRHGMVPNVKEAFTRYLNTRTCLEQIRRKLMSPQDAIALIHKAGGQAVLAHPGLLKMGRTWQTAVIRDLKQAGLDGIEAFYNQHEFMKKKYYSDFAEQCGLKLTAGTDFHGEKVKPKNPFGMELNDRWRERLLYDPKQ